MGSSSDEDISDISDSELCDYTEKPLNLLKSGTLRVRNSNGTLKCPFCLGKKKQDYQFKDLLQHAKGVSKGSSVRSGKQKANHLALAKYLEDEIAGKPEEKKSHLLRAPPVEQERHHPSGHETHLSKVVPYVFPWSAVVIKISEIHEDIKWKSEYLLKTFSEYNPIGVETFWNEQKQSMDAVLRFSGDWSGYVDANNFERSFETRGKGKRKSRLDPNIVGWIAREPDFESEGKVGEFLRSFGELRTIDSLSEERNQKRSNAVNNLANQIDVKNEYLNELRNQYNVKNMSLNRMLEEKERLHETFCEERKKLQKMARDHVWMVLEEQERMSVAVESRRKLLDSRSKELIRSEALTDRERQKLEEEKKKNDLSSDGLEVASMEQRKAVEKVSRLMEEHHKEREEAQKKILELQRELDDQQVLEMEIEHLKGQIQVMKHTGNEEDEGIKKKMVEMEEKLDEKMDQLEYMGTTNQALLIKERQSNDELHEARKLLIEAFKDRVSTQRAMVRVKKMGHMDWKDFKETRGKRWTDEEAMMLCSVWQDKLQNVNWHPFRIVEPEEGKAVEVIDDGDGDLKALREECGDDIHDVVVSALKEIHEYNPSGRYLVTELWNFVDKRKATMKECISFIIKNLPTNKRKRL